MQFASVWGQPLGSDLTVPLGTTSARGFAMSMPLDARVGWWTILKRTFKEVIDDNCLGLAAQLAYYFFLSLFPALLVVVTVTSFLPYHVLDDILAWFARFTPPDVLDIIQAQILQITKGGNAGLLTFGILGALWSSSSAMSAIIDTLNRAYGVKEARAWWKTQVLAVILTIALSVFMLASLTLVLAGPEIAEHIAARVGLGPVFAWTWKILQWPVAFLLISEGFALVYYLAPDAEQRWPWILPGAHIATLLWLAISVAFRFYIVNFGNFNKMYRVHWRRDRVVVVVLPLRTRAVVRRRAQFGNRTRLAVRQG